MSSRAFHRALTATGYLLPNGEAVKGLVRPNETSGPSRLRPALGDDRVGLKADAVFTSRSTPATIFKDAGNQMPTKEQLRDWHEAAWNVAVAPLLWVITPTDVRLYDCYSSPPSGSDDRPLETFELEEQHLRMLDAVAGRLVTETGAFWSSAIGQKIDRRKRVDRELLAEISALEDRLTTLNGNASRRYARHFAQRLIGRCIFTWYLLERGIAHPFLPARLPPDIATLFSTTENAFGLFSWLRSTFNGDLFPMDDPGAERRHLNDDHLALMQEFITGTSLIPEHDGQRRLFRFRFDAIPIDLISSIYQQFARSSAEDMADRQGLHYTPVELIHLTLDPVFEGLSPTARIIDPTCGSGAFLVEAFRRLVWRNTNGKQATRTLVRNILYHQLYGIDLNRSALGIAAFSLYLAALEFDEDPITDVADLKFHRLIGETLFEGNTLEADLPSFLGSTPFDAVVGNPPWTYDRAHVPPPRDPSNPQTARPRRSPDHAFLAVAGELAGNSGKIGMVMKASPFFSSDELAIASRQHLLESLAPSAVVNLSALRKEELFPDGDAPAMLFFSRCMLMEKTQDVLVGSIPWTSDFRRTGHFAVGPGMLRPLTLRQIRKTPATLKAAGFGTQRDVWLIDKLAQNFPTLEDALEAIGIKEGERRGQGFQVVPEGDKNEPPPEFYKLKVASPRDYQPFRLDEGLLSDFTHARLHRTRPFSLYQGPIVLSPKGSFRASVEKGRYTAAMHSTDILFTENLYGVSFAENDRRLASVLCAILNSSITTFQLAFGGGTWGLERATVEPHDLLALRVPKFDDLENTTIAQIVDAERAAAVSPSADRLHALDLSVCDAYDLDPDEIRLAQDSIPRARPLIWEAWKERWHSVRSPDDHTLDEYAQTVVEVVNRYLRARGARHMVAVIHGPLDHPNTPGTTSGLAAVSFSMAPGAPSDAPARGASARERPEPLVQFLEGSLGSMTPPYLNERRELRLYLASRLYFLKPNEARCWTVAAGLNDADTILADHWLGEQGAAITG